MKKILSPSLPSLGGGKTMGYLYQRSRDEVFQNRPSALLLLSMQRELTANLPP